MIEDRARLPDRLADDIGATTGAHFNKPARAIANTQRRGVAPGRNCDLDGKWSDRGRTGADRSDCTARKAVMIARRYPEASNAALSGPNRRDRPASIEAP